MESERQDAPSDAADDAASNAHDELDLSTAKRLLQERAKQPTGLEKVRDRLVAREALHALRAELLDVVGRHHGAVRHRAPEHAVVLLGAVTAVAWRLRDVSFVVDDAWISHGQVFPNRLV